MQHVPAVRRSPLRCRAPFVRRGKRLDDAYAIAETLLDDEEDLIHRATDRKLRVVGVLQATR